MASESGDGVVVVTGATGNLGGSVLARLRRSGARVIAVERTRILEREEVIGEVDLARAESVQQAFGLIARRGSIDAVIHTVGIYLGGADLLATRDQDFTSLFETNVLVTANVLRAALASMLPVGRGRIAVVCSSDALGGAAGQAPYAVSKAAQLSLVQSAAKEVRGRGVTINAVLPSTMDTPQNRAAMPDADPTQWLGLPAVAEVLCYLASPASAAIHGEAIRLGH